MSEIYLNLPVHDYCRESRNKFCDHNPNNLQRSNFSQLKINKLQEEKSESWPGFLLEFLQGNVKNFLCLSSLEKVYDVERSRWTGLLYVIKFDFTGTFTDADLKAYDFMAWGRGNAFCVACRRFFIGNLAITVGVISYMSGITLQLGISIFWIRASFRHKLLCSGYARILKIEMPRCSGVGLFVLGKE